MRRPSRTSLSWVIVFTFTATMPSIGQNIESIGREKPLSLAGGISVNQILSASRNTDSRRAPYSYFASGNLNISIYGWTVPLAFSLSNTHSTFTQPFNQYSMSPTWKWITAHAGYISMSFSPYTVNGHLFAGAAIDLAPVGKWKVSALYGRFLKAVAMDTLETKASSMETSQPSFQRNGYACKASYVDGGNSLELILFHAEDDKASIAQPADSLQITPHENFVISIKGAKTILKHMVLKAELAASAITKDTRAHEVSNNNLLAKSPLFFKSRLSSAYYHAVQTSIDYHGNGWAVGAGYERIDPGYRTLGAYYFNNDLENITLKGTAKLMHDKLNISLITGVHRDNLDRIKISTMRRMVSSLNFNIIPSHKLNLSGSWSTFQTFTRIRTPLESINDAVPDNNPDTLDFTQVLRTASLTGMVSLHGNEKRKHSLNINFTWQQAADNQNSAYAATHFYNFNAGYSLSIVPKSTSVTIALNAVVQDSPNISTRTIGPTASISRSFFDRKLRTVVSTSLTRIYNNTGNASRVINGRLNGILSIHAKHNMNLNAVLIRRNAAGSIREFTLSLGYQYSFGNKNHK